MRRLPRRRCELLPRYRLPVIFLSLGFHDRFSQRQDGNRLGVTLVDVLMERRLDLGWQILCAAVIP